MNRPALDSDEVYARSFEETYHRFEVVVYGNTPFEALTSLAQEGVTLPNFQTSTSRFLQTYPCQLTLVDVDFGYNALIEQGTSAVFDPDNHTVMSSPFLAGNLMGRLGTLGMHIVGLPQGQSRTVVCGNHNATDFASSTNSTQNSTTTIGYLKLQSATVNDLSIDRQLCVYNYYTPTVAATQTPLMIPNAFNSPIRIRFSYPLQRFTTGQNTPGFFYNKDPDTTFTWRNADGDASVPGLIYLDDFRLNYTNYQAHKGPFDGTGPVLSALVGDNDPGMLDVSVAAAIDTIKLPIRLLFQVRAVVRAVQPHEPNYK